MKNTYIIFVWLFVFGLFSCKEDPIQLPKSTDPVFVTSGTIGGEAFQLVAGDDNAYMYTMTEEENNVQVFSGEISNGVFSIQMGIYDGLVDQPTHEPLIEFSNVNKLFAHNDGNTVFLTLSKAVLQGMPNSQYIDEIKWFVDGEFKGWNEVEIKEPGVYNVCGEITFSDGETATLCNELIAGYKRNANCKIQFAPQQQQPGQIMVSVTEETEAIDKVRWFLNDQFVAETGGTFQTQVAGSMSELKCEVYFTNGVVRTKRLLVDAPSQNHCANDFSIFEYLASPKFQDFHIRLLIDKKGVSYSSEIVDNSNATIDISKVEYFGKNDQNKDVYKVSASISAEVKAVGGTTVLPVNFNTVFGIELP